MIIHRDGRYEVRTPSPNTQRGYRQVTLRDHPNQAWADLRNVRAHLTAKTWAKGAWLRGGQGALSPECLANTLRHVAVGTKDRPQTYANWYHRQSDAERVVTLIVRGRGYNSIPAFNDAQRTDLKDVRAVLDKAIALVAPQETTLADEVMSDAERDEVREALLQDWRDQKDRAQRYIDDLIARGWRSWPEIQENWTRDCVGDDCPEPERVG